MPSKRKIESETSVSAANAGSKWLLNDKVLCRYPNSDIYYEAKIIDVKDVNGESIYSVHYQGWNSRHDEKILETDAIKRFKPYTEEDAERARDIVKKAQQERKKRKSGVLNAGDAKLSKNVDGSSRASTPSVRSNQDGRRTRGQSSAAQSIAGDVAFDDTRSRSVRKIVLPRSLRKILTDDHNMVNKQHMLPKIPARISVYDIVQEYIKTLNDTKFREAAENEFFAENAVDYLVDDVINPCAETCEQSAFGLLDYFDMTVGSLLLYKFEKPLFSDLYAKETEKMDDTTKKSSADLSSRQIVRYSKHFGMVHFLRLFTRFTDTLEFTHWSSRALDVIVRHAQDFVIFLSKRYDEFYDIDADYTVAPPEYLKRVWGGVSQ